MNLRAVRSRRVEVADGTRLHARVWEPDRATGAGFLLVHGLASNARLWDGVGDALATAGHPVVAVDQRAHGASDPSDRLDLETLTADLVAVSAVCGLDRPVAVGQSWGGNVVVELGARHPGAVRGIAAIDGGTIELGGAFPDLETCWEQLAPPDWDALAVPYDQLAADVAARHRSWPEAGWRGQLANLLVRHDGTAAAILTRDRHRIIVEQLYHHRPLATLPDVPVPVLFLPVDTGDDGGTGGKRATTDRAVAAAPRAAVHWFHDRSHDVHAEAPDEVVAALLDHLDRLGVALTGSGRVDPTGTHDPEARP